MFTASGRGTPADRCRTHPDECNRLARVPILDVDGYLDSIERCRHRFPELRILTGVEFGQPHLHEAQASHLLDLGGIDLVLGSLHTLEVGDDRSEPNTLFRKWSADEVMWAYLDEIPRMVAGSRTFEVFTHIDYAVRAWPIESAGPFDPRRFEEGFRNAMRAIADSDRILEMNTRRLWPWIPQWWSEEGGKAVTFGSDAHVPKLWQPIFRKRPRCSRTTDSVRVNVPKSIGPADPPDSQTDISVSSGCRRRINPQ